jgi:hypothetical protein
MIKRKKMMLNRQKKARKKCPAANPDYAFGLWACA